MTSEKPIPARIFLQTGCEAEYGEADGPVMTHGEEMTWCADSIYKHDTEYVRADLVAALRSELSASKAENERLAKMYQALIETCEAVQATERQARADLTALRALLRRWITSRSTYLRPDKRGDMSAACPECDAFFDKPHEPGCIVADTRAAIGEEK